MSVRDDLFKLSDVVTELELAQEKAQIITGELAGDYFSPMDGQEWIIQHCHHNAGVKNSISLDYIAEIGDLLGTARKLIDSTWANTQERRN